MKYAGCVPYAEGLAQLRVQSEVLIDEQGYTPIAVEVSPQVRAHLEELHRTGLHGLTLEAVVEEIVREKVRENIRAGWPSRQAVRGRRRR